MLQQEQPDDYVIATGKIHTVREFCQWAFKEAGYSLGWQGEGVGEKGIDQKTREILVEVDPQYFRPTEVEILQGDATKAKEKLGWVPKVTVEALVKMMIHSDLKEAAHEAMCLKEGFSYNGCRQQNLYSRP